jgi:hypothetical protein
MNGPHFGNATADSADTIVYVTITQTQYVIGGGHRPRYPSGRII